MPRIRMDPAQFRVAIPAADPPGNITHELSFALLRAVRPDVDMTFEH